VFAVRRLSCGSAQDDLSGVRVDDKPVDLHEAVSIAVMPRSATPLGCPLLVVSGNRFRVLRLVPEQPRPMP
jgi:hypothetical protein